MSFAAPRQDRIGRLRLHVAVGEPAQAPPELRALELHPEGLPAEAIVVVRHLQMARRTAQPASAWRSAARAAVGVALRSAARPAEGAVPANCGVVRFADMAELLACLARDGLQGSLAAHWWWRELFPQGVDLDAVLAAWRAEGERTPGAAALLQAQGLWPAFVDCWPAHEVPGLRQVCESVAPAGGAGQAEHRLIEEDPAVSSAEPIEGLPLPARSPASHPEWGQPIWRASQRLSSDLPSLPGAAAAATVRLLPQAHPALPAPGGSATAARAHAAAASPAAPHARGPRPPVRAAAPAEAEPGLTPAPAVRSDRQTDTGPRPTMPWHGEQTHAPVPVPLPRPAPAGVAEVMVPAVPPPPRLSPFAAPPREARAFDTAFGGLFYLLNVALHLGLYPDFTQPRAHGLALSPWNLLAWLGRRWFGASLLQDPLWIALAQWAGRDPARDPAADFVAPADWQVPADWLRPFEPLPPLTLRQVGARRLLGHPAGFSLLDLPAGAPLPDAGGQAFVERPARTAHRFDVPQRWLAHLSRHVRARCALALQVNHGHVPRCVVHHRARVLRSGDGVTVRLSLAALPLPLRIAGLDRDPGWLPAAGCDVRFVFD